MTVIAGSQAFGLVRWALTQATTFYLFSLKINYADWSLKIFTIHLSESIFAGSPASLFSNTPIKLYKWDTPSSNFLKCYVESGWIKNIL